MTGMKLGTTRMSLVSVLLWKYDTEDAKLCREVGGNSENNFLILVTLIIGRTWAVHVTHASHLGWVISLISEWSS